MKNNTLSRSYYPKNPQIKHFFRIMRITLFLLMACVFSLYAGNSYSQNTRVSFAMDNVGLNKVLEEIESQTDYLFIYNSQINVNKLVTIKANKQTVSKVLDQILQNTGIEYKLEGSHIILEKKVEEVTIDDFAKLQFKVGTIVKCEPHPKADRLLVEQVDLGGEVRQIVSGIAKHYKPEELIGKQVVVVTNLKPVKLRGVESYGMILCATDDKDLSFVTVAKEMPNGVTVR